MNKKVRVKVGKGQSLAGCFVGVMFVIIGMFFVIPTFGVFGVIWTLGSVAITVTHGINAFTDKGITSHTIEIEEENKIIRHDTNIELRLEQLKSLYQNNLITESEYEKKKAEMLEEL